LRSSTSKKRERESGNVYVRNYIRKEEKNANPTIQSSPEHLEDKHMSTNLHEEKTSKLKTSKKRRTEEDSPHIVAIDTHIEDPLVVK
jgi:hypothetical protein